MIVMTKPNVFCYCLCTERRFASERPVHAASLTAVQHVNTEAAVKVPLCKANCFDLSLGLRRILIQKVVSIRHPLLLWSQHPRLQQILLTIGITPMAALQCI